MSRRGGERRRFVRVDDEVVVSLVPIDAHRRDGRTLNFSAGGVLVLSPTLLDPGTGIRIALRLGHDGRLLEFDAVVVRVRTLADRVHEVAAEFVGGSAGDQRELQDLIARRLGAGPVAPQPA